MAFIAKEFMQGAETIHKRLGLLQTEMSDNSRV